MSTHHCCNIDSSAAHRDMSDARNTARALRPPNFRQRLIGAAEWIVPGIVLAILPKCPVCIAAYIAIVTGVGISVSTAAHIRMFLVLLCAGSLIYLTFRVTGRLIQRRYISR
jgi:hypothetical protein